MGASPPQLRGAVLARLKAEFSLVAMKAGCMRAMESLPAVAVERLWRAWVGRRCFRPLWRSLFFLRRRMRVRLAFRCEEAPGCGYFAAGLVVLPSGVRVPLWFCFGYCRPGLLYHH